MTRGLISSIAALVLAAGSAVAAYPDKPLRIVTIGIGSGADVATRLDAAARRNGVSICGTGINPGFSFDTLPLVLARFAPQQPRAEPVKRADPHAISRDESLDAGLHFASGLICKGDCQNPRGPDSPFDKVCNPPRDNTRLARAWSRQNQQRPVAVVNRFRLRWIEIESCRHDGRTPFPTGHEARVGPS